MPKMQRGAAKTQRGPDGINAALSWDDLRVFSVCAEKGSFRSAARQLALDSATVVRRMGRLEQLLDIPLFNRLSEGVRLTEAGIRVFEQTRAMEQSAFNIVRSSQIELEEAKGDVKVAVTEGLGTYWILPRLLEFQKGHRYLTIEMDCAMTPTDVMRLQADISIQFNRPENPDLIALRLGFLHMYPFASSGYVKLFGTPEVEADLINHRLIQQVGPLIDEELREITQVPLDKIIAFRTNGSTAMLYAIERDIGIGFLPTYASVLAPSLVPINLGGSRRLEIWMTYHPDLKESRRHMLVVDWLKGIFNARLFPCFAKAFIHPDELVKQMAETAKVNRTEGFGAPAPA